MGNTPSEATNTKNPTSAAERAKRLHERITALLADNDALETECAQLLLDLAAETGSYGEGRALAVDQDSSSEDEGRGPAPASTKKSRQRISPQELQRITQILINRCSCRHPVTLERVSAVYRGFARDGLAADELRGYVACALTQILRELEYSCATAGMRLADDDPSRYQALAPSVDPRLVGGAVPRSEQPPLPSAPRPRTVDRGAPMPLSSASRARAGKATPPSAEWQPWDGEIPPAMICKGAASKPNSQSTRSEGVTAYDVDYEPEPLSELQLLTKELDALNASLGGCGGDVLGRGSEVTPVFETSAVSVAEKSWDEVSHAKVAEVISAQQKLAEDVKAMSGALEKAMGTNDSVLTVSTTDGLVSDSTERGAMSDASITSRFLCDELDALKESLAKVGGSTPDPAITGDPVFHAAEAEYRPIPTDGPRTMSPVGPSPSTEPCAPSPVPVATEDSFIDLLKSSSAEGTPLVQEVSATAMRSKTTDDTIPGVATAIGSSVADMTFSPLTADPSVLAKPPPVPSNLEELEPQGPSPKSCGKGLTAKDMGIIGAYPSGPRTVQEEAAEMPPAGFRPPFDESRCQQRPPGFWQQEFVDPCTQQMSPAAFQAQAAEAAQARAALGVQAAPKAQSGGFFSAFANAMDRLFVAQTDVDGPPEAPQMSGQMSGMYVGMPEHPAAWRGSGQPPHGELADPGRGDPGWKGAPRGVAPVDPRAMDPRMLDPRAVDPRGGVPDSRFPDPGALAMAKGCGKGHKDGDPRTMDLRGGIPDSRFPDPGALAMAKGCGKGHKDGDPRTMDLRGGIQDSRFPDPEALAMAKGCGKGYKDGGQSVKGYPAANDAPVVDRGNKYAKEVYRQQGYSGFGPDVPRLEALGAAQHHESGTLRMPPPEFLQSPLHAANHLHFAEFPDVVDNGTSMAPPVSAQAPVSDSAEGGPCFAESAVLAPVPDAQPAEPLEELSVEEVFTQLTFQGLPVQVRLTGRGFAPKLLCIDGEVEKLFTLEPESPVPSDFDGIPGWDLSDLCRIVHSEATAHGNPIVSLEFKEGYLLCKLDDAGALAGLLATLTHSRDEVTITENPDWK